MKIKFKGGGFRNNYLALFILLSFSFTVNAQVYQTDPAYGRKISRYDVTSALHIPTFCGVPNLTGDVVLNKAAIAFDSCNALLYTYNPKDSSWAPATGSGTIIVSGSGVDSITYSSNQLCQWVDGVSTCYRLNKFFDSTSYNFDSSRILLYNNGTVRDSIAGRTTINLHYPLQSNLADSSINFRSDSLVSPLKYSGIDSSSYDAKTLIPKEYLESRIAAFVSGGITRSELSDTAAAISSRKQDLLISGTNIKTINGTTVLGSGDLVISGGGGTTLNGTGYVKMAGTTPSYVTSPTDSTAYHSAAAYQDTTLILKRPNGINDSVSFHIGIPQSGWLLGGNMGTKSDSNFIGTIDTAALSFRVNNKIAGRIDSMNATNGRALFGFGAAPLTTEKDVTAFGYKAANSLTTGGFPTYYGNTAIGNMALSSVTTTGYNTAVGYNALKSSTGTANTALGFNAITSGVAGSNNTAVGTGALSSQASNNNTAIGYTAMGSGSGTGGSNTVVGANALGASTINGSSNSAFGYSAGGLNASGGNNLYLGNYAGYNNTSSSSIFISSIGSRGSLLNDQTQSPIYAVQSGINNYNGTTQKVSLNGKIGNNTISPTAWWNLSRGDGTTAPLKFEPPITISATGGSSTSTYITVNFATQTDYPFVWGTKVTLSGFTPSDYNGTFQVLNSTTSSVTLATSLNPGAVTVNGTITQGGLKTTPANGEFENDSTGLYYSSGTGSNFLRSALIKGRSGTATLSAGTVTVSTAYIKADSRILVSVATPIGTQGFLSVPTASIIAGTSFVINSTSATETSIINWLIINP